MRRLLLFALLAIVVFATPAGAHPPKYCGHDSKYINSLTMNYFVSHYANRDHLVETWTWSPTSRRWLYNDSHRWDCH